MAGVQGLADAVQDLAVAVGRRLVVLDEQGVPVAWSIHEEPADRRRLSVVLAESDSWPDVHRLTERDTRSLGDLGTLTLLPLSISRARLGTMIVMPVDPPAALTPEAWETLQDGGDHVSSLLAQRNLEARALRNRVRDLLRRLVGPDPSGREQAAEALLQEGHIGGSNQFCTVAIGKEDDVDVEQTVSLAVEETLGYVRRTATATITGALLEGGIGIVVFPRPFVPSRLHSILGRKELQGTRAGSGPLVPSLGELHHSFDRARLALSVTLRAPGDHPRVLVGHDLGLDGLLVRLPLDDLTREDLPAGLGRLLDARNASVLWETLEAYLAAGGDAQRTAHDLHIHRSTLYYRLDQLRETLDQDVRDGLVRRELHVGLRVAALAGLAPRGPG